jgi:hypothetical protein
MVRWKERSRRQHISSGCTIKVASYKRHRRWPNRAQGWIQPWGFRTPISNSEGVLAKRSQSPTLSAF